MQEDWVYKVPVSSMFSLPWVVSLSSCQNETQEAEGSMSSGVLQDATTDALVNELAPEQEVDDTQHPQTSEPQQHTRQEELVWNDATLVMHDRSHHVDVRYNAWQIWAESVRLRRMISSLDDDSLYKI